VNTLVEILVETGANVEAGPAMCRVEVEPAR
jgi:biotin carboxyl carrier protein